MIDPVDMIVSAVAGLLGTVAALPRVEALLGVEDFDLVTAWYSLDDVDALFGGVD